MTGLGARYPTDVHFLGNGGGAGLLVLLGLTGPAGCAGESEPDAGEPAPVLETLGNHLDDDGDGQVDELGAADALAPDEVIGSADVGVLALEGAGLPVIYPPAGTARWFEAAPLGYRTDPDLCCGSELLFWVSDLDGDALPELLVNGDDRYWFEGMWFSRTVVYPGDVAVGGGFSLSDARWTSESTVIRVLDPEGPEPRWVYYGREGTAVAPASALSDGALQREEANAEVAGGPLSLPPGQTDLDGDGLDDLVVVIGEGGTSTTPVTVQVHSGAALDALSGEDTPPFFSARLPDDSYGVRGGTVTDLDGDGTADLVAHWRANSGYGAAFGAWMGPLGGDMELHVVVEVPHTRRESGGSLLALGDVEGDQRDDLGFGLQTDDDTSFSIVLGAALAAGGTLDLAGSRYAVRTGFAYGPLVTSAFAGQLDGNPGIDLSLYTRDPVGPAGSDGEIGPYEAELYFELGR